MYKFDFNFFFNFWLHNAVYGGTFNIAMDN